MQEVELAADVHRNLNAAITALEELEQQRTSTAGPAILEEGKVHKKTNIFAVKCTATTLSVPA